MSDQTPLYNLEAEMSVLGSMIIREVAAEEVFSILDEEDFYHPAHQMIYRSMQDLAHGSKPIDLVTLKNNLSAHGKLQDVGDEDYLIQVAEVVPSAANATWYAGIVKEKATIRALHTASQDISVISVDPEKDAVDKLNEAEGIIFQIGQRSSRKPFKDARSIARDYMVDVDNLLDTGEPTLGIPTGFVDLDRITTGLYGGNLYIIAARPSMGKTSFVLKVALNVARKNPGSVAVFSLEMSDRQLGRRLVSLVSQIPSSVLKKADLDIETYKRLANACETIYDLPLFIDESSGITPLEMRGKCRRLKRQEGLSLVIVDYLQLMSPPGKRASENRTQELSQISKALKGLAKELDVPVIALSQLNRAVESRENKRPQLADIRESGAIEEDADLVAFLYRDNYYKARTNPDEADTNPDRTEVAELIIAKHRDGDIGTVDLAFTPKYATFENLAA